MSSWRAAVCLLLQLQLSPPHTHTLTGRRNDDHDLLLPFFFPMHATDHSVSMFEREDDRGKIPKTRRRRRRRTRNGRRTDGRTEAFNMSPPPAARPVWLASRGKKKGGALIMPGCSISWAV